MLLKQDWKEDMKDEGGTEDLKSQPAEDNHVDEKPEDEGDDSKMTGAGENTYTYLVSGWERSTDIPLLPAEDQASGPGLIVLLLLLLLLLLGKDRQENIPINYNLQAWSRHFCLCAPLSPRAGWHATTPPRWWGLFRWGSPAM